VRPAAARVAVNANEQISLPRVGRIANTLQAVILEKLNVVADSAKVIFNVFADFQRNVALY